MPQKIFITMVALFLFPLLCFSQREVEGKIIDYDNTGVELAEIIFTNTDTMTQIYDVSDAEGNFLFHIKDGSYLLEIKIFGRIYFSKNLEIKSNLQLGNIVINTSTGLDEIIIQVQKKQIEKKVDRLVFNVENIAQSSGTDALELIKIAPRIKVQNDQISMIGKSTMSVMVDDRLIQLSSGDLVSYLRSIRSEDIQSIEVITNPPSKYSAEGNSGIINIITKKKKEDFWNASLQTGYKQTTYPGGRVGASFNYKKNNFALNLNTGYYDGSNAPVDRSVINYTDIVWDESNKRHDFTKQFSTNLGVDYRISEKISTGISYRYNPNRMELRSQLRSNLLNLHTSTIDSTIVTPSSQLNNTKLHTLNYHFIFEMDTLGRKLSFDFDYFNYNSSSNRNFTSTTYNASDLTDPIDLYSADNKGEQEIDNYSFNMDMEHPIGWAEFNYGVRLSGINTDSGFNYFDLTSGIPVFDPLQSSEFNYKEHTQAGYFSTQKKLSEKWEAKIGVRLENTQTRGNSITLDQTNKLNYTKLFPTAYINYVPGENNSFSLSYSRRISRPNFKMLNPFRWIASAYSYSEGNPYLQPAFTDNVEFEYMYKENLISSIYFSYTNNDFEELLIVNPETNIQQIIPKNFIVNKTIGFNQTYIFKPLTWWNLNAFFTTYYSHTDSKVPVTLQYLKGWNGDISISNDLNLNSKKTLFFNIRYSYTTKGVDNLDYNSAFDQLNLTFKGLFLENKLVASLHFNDVLSSNRITYTSYSNGLKTTSRSYYDTRYLLFSLTYNFGKKFNTINREIKNQEEQQRIN